MWEVHVLLGSGDDGAICVGGEGFPSIDDNNVLSISWYLVGLSIFLKYF